MGGANRVAAAGASHSEAATEEVRRSQTGATKAQGFLFVISSLLSKASLG
jgi:hypothetical protein